MNEQVSKISISYTMINSWKPINWGLFVRSWYNILINFKYTFQQWMKLSFQNDFKHLCHLPTKTPIKKQFITSYSWYSKLFYPGSNCSMVESIVCVFYLHCNHDSTRAVLFPWIILFTTGKKLSYRMHWTKLCMKHISFFVMTSLSNTAINLRLLMKFFIAQSSRPTACQTLQKVNIFHTC